MVYFKKFISRIIDYLFFAFLFLFFYDIDLFNIYDWILVGCLPLLWAPVEALLLYFFKTTIGKAIVGFYTPEQTLKESLKTSFLSAVKIQLYLIPGINLIAFYFFSRKKSFSPFRLEFRLTPFCLSIFTALAVPLLLVEINAPKAKNMLIDWAHSHWQKMTSEDLAFTAYFPGEPVVADKELLLPTGHDVTLPYKEYRHASDEAVYSISRATLPSSWMKWRSGLILSGALKVVTNKSRIKFKQSSTFHELPSLDYEAESKEGEILGKLVLVGQDLYKVEALYHGADGKEEAVRFIESFSPNN